MLSLFSLWVQGSQFLQIPGHIYTYTNSTWLKVDTLTQSSYVCFPMPLARLQSMYGFSALGNAEKQAYQS